MSGKDVDFAGLVSNTKSMYKEPEHFKECQAFFVKEIDESKRQIEAVVSTADLDRYDEIIEPEAFRESLDAYLKNPVVISSHRQRLETGHSSVVGQTVKTWIDKAGLHVIIQFAETELGDEFWYLYKNKFQRAFSVGFIPLEWRDETLDSGQRVRTYTKVELLEISCVPVPANRNALSKSKQRKANFIEDKKIEAELRKQGLLDDDAAIEFAELILGLDGDEEVLDDLDLQESSAADCDFTDFFKSRDMRSNRC